MVKPTVEQRFWSKVDRVWECWLWSAFTDANGYGRFYDGSRQVMAHRYSYELLVGPIPPRLQMDHLCRHRSCVNPDHLEAVTCRVNLLRGRGAAAPHLRRIAAYLDLAT